MRMRMRLPTTLKRQSSRARPGNTANHNMSATVLSACFQAHDSVKMMTDKIVTAEVLDSGMAASCLVFSGASACAADPM